ncbi:hypothetical protein GLOIN_2v1825509 [Rhizophagus irregularis DAOM 181602=DAOM 197198]|nr:hypothetical protein GLOIN_2v1825509 [Rhizophagus irregularis DAOM 181602=DAOM 197198]
MKSIEENCSKKLSLKTRLYFLLEFVKSLNHDDYFYVRKLDDIQLLELPFDSKFIKLNEEIINNLQPLFKKME